MSDLRGCGWEARRAHGGVRDASGARPLPSELSILYIITHRVASVFVQSQALGSALNLGEQITMAPSMTNTVRVVLPPGADAVTMQLKLQAQLCCPVWRRHVGHWSQVDFLRADGLLTLGPTLSKFGRIRSGHLASHRVGLVFSRLETPPTQTFRGQTLLRAPELNFYASIDL